MARNFLHIFVAIVAFLSFAFSQSGKISGVVTDAKTRETLAGVNVFVEGTKLGAVSDIDGRFAVLRIPPGTYAVSASLLGFSKVTVRSVEVFIDRTTEVNFKLSDATVEMQEVSVVAERPKIIKDQTSTATTLDNAQIRAVATEGLRGVLDLSASFQKDAQGNFSVRGSNAYELNFQINGVTQTNSATSVPGSFGSDKANNSWKYDVNPLAVQQLQVISGGFTAEHGDAQAGVVKVVTKEGTEKLKGEIRVELRPPGQYHWGTYLYDESNFEWQRWGKIEGWYAQKDRVISDLQIDTRYATLKAQADAGNQVARRMYDSIVTREIVWAHSMWVKNHTPSDDNPLGVYDYRKGLYQRFLWGVGGPLGNARDLLTFYFSGEYRSAPTRLPTPERNLVFQNYLLNVTYTPLKNQKFKFTGMYQNYRGGIYSGSDDIRWSGLAFTPPGTSTKYAILVDPVRKERTVAQSANWVWAMSDQSFIEATFAHQNETYELPYEYLPGWENQVDRLDSANDVSGTILRPGAWWETSSAQRYFRDLQVASTLYYQDNRTEHWSENVDYYNPMNQSHLLKTGAKVLYWDMVNNGVNSSFIASAYAARTGFADYYRAFPFNASVYIQDKMEFKGMVANIGMRAETYNFHVPVPADPFNPFYQGSYASGTGEVGNPETVPSETKVILLPRVGVSFPIGENTAFRIQYGHFASMPIFSQGLSQRTESGWIGRNNPNLDPKKTINYEFGLQQVINENHRLDLAIYYNDRVSQIGLVRYAALTGSINRTANASALDGRPLYLYTTYDNNAFGSTIGIEVKFEKIAIGRWTYRLSYNLSQTTAGNFGPAVIFPTNLTRYTRGNFTGEFLSSSDRTHSFRGVLQHSLGEGEGVDLGGFKPFANTTASLTYTAQSGTPFTWPPTDISIEKGIVNNRRFPIETSFDLNIVKTFVFSGANATVGLRIMNVFDNKWLTPTDVRDDLINLVENGITVADPGNDPLRQSYAVAQYRAYRNLPRQIFFTVGIGF